jgi:hypothetical protein
MKWFFTLNENANDYDAYARLAKVAVLSAAKHTSLEPIFLYDGAPCPLTNWMSAHDVIVVRRRSFLYDLIAEEAERRDNDLFLRVGGGAFLRLEVPGALEEIGYKDDFVLYTDLDVMFVDDVAPLDEIKPKYFASAPENARHDRNHVNTGVMLMNINGLRADQVRFHNFVERNISTLINESFDQGAYNRFYRRGRIARRIFGNKWTRLDPVYNWKPYWGYSPSAKIVHFHGPKPHQADVILSDDVPDHLKHLRPMLSEGFFEYRDMWNEYARSLDV